MKSQLAFATTSLLVSSLALAGCAQSDCPFIDGGALGRSCVAEWIPGHYLLHMNAVNATLHNSTVRVEFNLTNISDLPVKVGRVRTDLASGIWAGRNLVSSRDDFPNDPSHLFLIQPGVRLEIVDEMPIKELNGGSLELMIFVTYDDPEKALNKVFLDYENACLKVTGGQIKPADENDGNRFCTRQARQSFGRFSSPVNIEADNYYLGKRAYSVLLPGPHHAEFWSTYCPSCYPPGFVEPLAPLP